MNAMNAAPVDQRTRALRALGVTPWVLRTAVPADDVPAPGPAAAVVEAAHGDCVVLLPAGSDPRALDVLSRALHACGAVVARAARLEVREGKLPSVPAAKAYLAFGEAQAHALGRELPAALLQQAHIVLADEPAALVGSPAAKRRLWNALRTLRRALARQTD
ncbi:hypothetical protein EYV96_08635 [Dyella terrae]|uniref:Uncharacterized protein n=3 Tax=Rhodanobacteraceae TaxID=1775411 RepID=A0A4R0YUQ7_9GAMM|nr:MULTISPECIES: ABC transporter ATP-binding protein [Dyella]TBR40217.1 hypothetical protein EYV96_08635 [Dyella terrae]TCI12201.1 hypothetical protein EZM97_02235 [Dyella soli]